MQLRELTPDRPTTSPDDVQPLENLSRAAQASFAEFAEKLSGEGFAFLADYQLLPTEVGGASDPLCRADGLTDLGLVRTTAV